MNDIVYAALAASSSKMRCNNYIRVYFSNATLSNNYKYISRALDPSVSNLHEAQSAVQVQLKPNKPHKDGRVKGQGPNIKQTTIIHYITLSFIQCPNIKQTTIIDYITLSFIQSPPPPRSHVSVTFALTDKSATHKRQQASINQ